MKKKLFGLSLIGACLFTMLCYPASYELYRLFDGTSTTNNAILPGGFATDKALTSRCTNIFMSSASNCTLFIAFKFTGSGTENVVTTIERSYDRIHWESAYSLVKAGNGTTEVTAFTNIAAGEYGFFRVSQIENGSVRIATNIYLSWSAKQ